jgi:hypothetical protein
MHWRYGGFRDELGGRRVEVHWDFDVHTSFAFPEEMGSLSFSSVVLNSQSIVHYTSRVR